MTTDSHSRGSKRSHNKRKKDAKEDGKGEEMSQEIIDRYIVELKASVDAIIKLLEKCEKDQSYGWTTKRKKIKWKLLQKQIKRRMYIKLREEFRAAKLEMEDSYVDLSKRFTLLRKESLMIS